MARSIGFEAGTSGNDRSRTRCRHSCATDRGLGICILAFEPTISVGEFSQANRDYVRKAGEKIESHFAESRGHASRRPVIAGFGLAPAFYAGVCFDTWPMHRKIWQFSTFKTYLPIMLCCRILK